MAQNTDEPKPFNVDVGPRRDSSILYDSEKDIQMNRNDSLSLKVPQRSKSKKKTHSWPSPPPSDSNGMEYDRTHPRRKQIPKHPDGDEEDDSPCPKSSSEYSNHESTPETVGSSPETAQNSDTDPKSGSDESNYESCSETPQNSDPVKVEFGKW